jgi:hypothetical protein
MQEGTIMFSVGFFCQIHTHNLKYMHPQKGFENLKIFENSLWFRWFLQIK